MEQQRNDNCALVRRHRVIADHNGVHAAYRYGPDRLMLRSPLLSNDENFPNSVQRCTRNYALIPRTGVRRVRIGADDPYSHMSRGTLRTLASHGALADYSSDGYVVDGNAQIL